MADTTTFTTVTGSTSTTAYTQTPKASTVYEQTLYNDIMKQNDQLKQSQNDMTSNFSTYDQRAIYQQQQLDTLMNINFWMWITYYFKVVVVIYYLFRMPSDFSFRFKIIFTIVMLIYPYVIGILEYYGWTGILYIWSLINVDIYSQPIMKKTW